MGVLVAGVGNALRGDDAFGVAAAQALTGDVRLPEDVAVLETGIGGIHLAQELMRGYGFLILFDACDRGGEPGRLYVLEPELPETAAMDDRTRRDFFADTHYATPVRALTLARELGALPPLVRIIGCQIAEADAFGTTMSPPVAAAVPNAVEIALRLIATLSRPRARA